MGMFNKIWVPCPTCGEYVEFQTKSGSKELLDFNIRDVPEDELRGIFGDIEVCEYCGTRVEIEDPEKKRVDGTKYVRDLDRY